ncbi:MAG TPA: metalloregulator ArsR/SmtB family transcription factor [Gammaproteobacteria bacterium]|nr:metalloregulator ArsR/SmtB family transcription factor [Gammaproteobacteria bacterium]
MVNYKDATLDKVFTALSDSTRRHVLASLSEGSLSVSELAGPHDMSLPGFMKHLRVLEEAGLIALAKEGRVVRCTISAKPMQQAVTWLVKYQRFWNARLDALDHFLEQEEESTSWQHPRVKKNRRFASSGTTRQRRKKSGRRGLTRKR